MEKYYAVTKKNEEGQPFLTWRLPGDIRKLMEFR